MRADRLSFARLLLPLLASASPLAVSPALAANTPDAAATNGSGPAESTTSGADIVVTATKRSETLQNVPLAIAAVGNEALKEHHVANFDDYAKLLPSVSYQSFGPGQSQLNFRGITTGSDGDSAGPLPTAGLYIDETPVTTLANSVDLHVYDMARVEALAGPQGTLYGASSLSGTLRLITNKPVIGKWEGGIDLDANTYVKGSGGGKAEGYLNIPLNASMALRVVGYYEHDGGYINNTPVTRTYERYHDDGTGTIVTSPMTVNNDAYAKKNFNTADAAGGRAALKVDLDSNWTVTPAIIYQHMKTNGSFLTDPNAGDLSVHDFANEYNRDDWYLASLTVQGKISDWDLTYSGSYFDRRTDSLADYSYYTVAYDALGQTVPGYTYYKDGNGNDINPTQFVHLHDHNAKTSHELRLSSPNSNRWRLTAGLFYQGQTNSHAGDYLVPGLANIDQSGAFPGVNTVPVPGATNPDDNFNIVLHRIQKDYAAFAEGTFDFTPQLSLIAGIRGFIAQNKLTGFSGNYGAIVQYNQIQTAAGLPGCAQFTVQGCPNTNGDQVEHGETHKVELKWQPERNKMFYVTYSTGFRPGGTNPPQITPPTLAAPNGTIYTVPNFKSDTLTNYELGWKTAWLNRSLFVNGALFWEDWKNFQYGQPGYLGIYYTVTPGNARARGAEAQISWKNGHGLTLSGTATYVDAKLTTDFRCVVSVGCNGDPVGTLYAPKGTQLPVTPKFKTSASARYDTTFLGWDAYLQADATHQGGTISQLRTGYEALEGPTKGFTTFDFSAGISQDHYSFGVYANNAFDSRGVLTKNSACAPNYCGIYARNYITKPQQIGITAGYKF